MKTTTKKSSIALLVVSINLIFSIGLIRAQSTAVESITNCDIQFGECFAIHAPVTLSIPLAFVDNEDTQKNIFIGFNTNVGQYLQAVDYRLNGGFQVSTSVSPFYLANDGTNSYSLGTSPLKINYDNIKIVSYNQENGNSVDGNLPQYAPASSLIKPVTSDGNFTYENWLTADRTDENLYPERFTGAVPDSSDPLVLINADVPPFPNNKRYGNYHMGLGFLIQLPRNSVNSGMIDGTYNLDVTFNLSPTP